MNSADVPVDGWTKGDWLVTRDRIIVVRDEEEPGWPWENTNDGMGGRWTDEGVKGAILSGDIVFTHHEPVKCPPLPEKIHSVVIATVLEEEDVILWKAKNGLWFRPGIKSAIDPDYVKRWDALVVDRGEAGILSQVYVLRDNWTEDGVPVDEHGDADEALFQLDKILEGE